MGLVQSKIAIVTGAAQGIGAAIAERLAGEGATVALVDLNLAGCEQVAERIQGQGGKAHAFQTDVSSTEQVTGLVAEIIKQLGRVDILVNNAGVTRDALLLRMSEQDWDSVLSVNLKGIFNFTKAVTRGMMKQKSGAIVNISSVVGLTGNAGQLNYAASRPVRSAPPKRLPRSSPGAAFASTRWRRATSRPR